jgi:hypothetical protein
MIRTRLELLRRGRGNGFLAALADPAAARDEVLQCIVHDDPERDAQVERRARWFAELCARLDVPLAPIAAHVGGRDPDAQPAVRLGYEVLAAAWVRGHAPARQLLMRPGVSAELVDGVASAIWGQGWATPERRREMPRRAVECVHRLDEQWGTTTDPPPPIHDAATFAELLDLAVAHWHHGALAVLQAELTRRAGPADRLLLAEVVAQDPEPARVRMAALVLGQLGDDRLLPLAEQEFARPDEPLVPARALPDWDRQRRVALLHYVAALPAAATLAAARRWRPRGGYFEVVAVRVLERHAEPADREWVEELVRRELPTDPGYYAPWLDVLARLADPRSAPLLAEVVERATYSYARVRALRAFARMVGAAGAAALLHEALWDAEDEAVRWACALQDPLDREAVPRLAELGDDPTLKPAVRDAVLVRQPPASRR